MPIFPAFLLLACQAPCSSAPLTNLVSHYLHGDQLSAEVTPDGTRAFVAEGAVISILDLTPPSGPAVVHEVPLPDCQALAQAYFQHPSGDRYLFLAGGGLGLWRLTLCPSLFQATPSGCASYAPLLVDEIVSPAFERKRCVDVEVVEGSAAGDPVLYALFAASDSSGEASSATELRAYRLNGTSCTPLAPPFVFPSSSPQAHAAKGAALAEDPGNHDAVYVAMGKGGLWRADLALQPQPSLSLSQLWVQTAPYENLRDIAVLRIPAGACGARAMVYGALGYGHILEYDLLAAQATVTPTSCGFPAKIAVRALGESSSSVLVAVAQEVDPRSEEETWAPYTANGFWTGICVDYFLEDPDQPTPSPSGCMVIQFYQRDLCQASTLAVVPGAEISPFKRFWGSLVMQAASATVSRVYGCTSGEGTAIYETTVTGTSGTSTFKGRHVGKAFAAQEGFASQVNPGVIRFGQEYPGRVEVDGLMLHIDTSPPYDISVITGTTNCQPPIAPPCSAVANCNLNSDGQSFVSGILGECSWVDPQNPQQEWFLCGNSTHQRVTIGTGPQGECVCTPIDLCTAADPCSSSSPSYFRRGPTSLPDVNRVAWQLVRLTLPAAGIPSGATMDMRWRQLELPPADGEAPTLSSPYISSRADPRTDPVTGMPVAIYTLRGGTTHGARVIGTSALHAAAQQSCLSPSGRGEPVELDPNAVEALLTHVERQQDATGACGPAPSTICTTGSTASSHPRYLFNHRADVYTTRDSQGNTAWILAVASGFPAAMSTAFPNCPWLPYGGRPMLDLFDVTNVEITKKAQLLRVGIGSLEGHAFALETKRYGTGPSGRSYAFVGDLQGRLSVFNVSGSQIFPPANDPYLPGTPVLQPVTTLEFPRDPYDGHRANVIDMEIEGNYLYCALGRIGVGIVDITQGSAPVLCGVLDTPGLAMGITMRTVTDASGSHRQMIVGDSRGGVRVYE